MKIFSFFRVFGRPFRARERRWEWVQRALVEVLMRLDDMTAEFDRLKAAVTRITDIAKANVAMQNGYAQMVRDMELNAQCQTELADQIEREANSMGQAVVANTVADPNVGGEAGTPGDVPAPDGEPAARAPLE